MSGDAPGALEKGLRVGYILTHYPRISQTFISGEIRAVEAAGVHITTFAMNAPALPDRSPSGASELIERTTYLKPQLGRAVLALARFGLTHPFGAARVFWMAAASADGSLRRFFRRMSHLVQAALVAQIAVRRRLDYLHAHFGLAPATIAWLASAFSEASGRRLPFGFTIHGFHDFVDQAESRLDLKARAAAQVLCISDFTRSQLCLVTDKAVWQRFAVTRCGVDLSQLQYRDPPPIKKVPGILAVGRLSPEKGFDVLVEAMAIMTHEGMPAKLTIVGDGPERSSLVRAADAAGVGTLIEFTGELLPHEVQERLERADIFCLPSFSEGLPVSIMEAMAVGVPVVTTWIAGIPELAEAEVTALTVPPARPDALARSLRRLSEDHALRFRLAQAARGRVEAMHDQALCGRIVADRFHSAAIG